MWNVKEPTHYSKRVGSEVPGVLAVLCVVRQVRLGWGAFGSHLHLNEPSLIRDTWLNKITYLLYPSKQHTKQLDSQRTVITSKKKEKITFLSLKKLQGTFSTV